MAGEFRQQREGRGAGREGVAARVVAGREGQQSRTVQDRGSGGGGRGEGMAGGSWRNERKAAGGGEEWKRGL